MAVELVPPSHHTGTLQQGWNQCSVLLNYIQNCGKNVGVELNLYFVFEFLVYLMFPMYLLVLIIPTLSCIEDYYCDIISQTGMTELQMLFIRLSQQLLLWFIFTVVLQKQMFSRLVAPGFCVCLKR